MGDTMDYYYDARKQGALALDKDFYDRIAKAEKRQLIRRDVIPSRSGHAWEVRAGQVFRVVDIEGPQVGDFNVWNLNNPREHFWSVRTRQFEGAHLTTGSRMWSCLPYLRPMLTMTNDTLPAQKTPMGGRYHGLLGSRCDPYMYKLVDNRDVDVTCHNNLTRAVAPHHLTEMDVHDCINLFQISGFDTEREVTFTEASKAKPGDFVEFFAEIDVLCAISNCLCGDSSVILRGPNRGDPSPTCKKLAVEVYDVDSSLLKGWKSPEPVQIGSVY
jgi:uncharacterized protein